MSAHRTASSVSLRKHADDEGIQERRGTPATPRPPSREPVRCRSHGTSARKSGSRAVAMLAHEVRRRVSAIRMLTEAIGVLYKRGKNPKTMVDRLIEEVDDLEALIRTLAGGADANVSSVIDLGLAVQAAARTVAAAHGARLAVDLPVQPVTVWTNATLLRQAVENLIENAARYSRGALVEVAVETAGGMAELTVADRGTGLQGGAGLRGSGFGLQLVQRTAELAGGQVWCADRPGGGALFGLCLLVKQDER